MKKQLARSRSSAVHKFLLQGIAIGLLFAVPVGPIGILCIRRSLAEGCKSGLATGLGAATADAIFGAVAAFGLTAVSEFLLEHSVWFSLLGGLFLFYIGVDTFRSKPAIRGVALTERSGYGSIFFSTLLLTLTNPMSVLLFVGTFASFGSVKPEAYDSAGALVAGVFLGSMLWWVTLSSSVASLRSRVTPGWMEILNRLAGSVIRIFGIYTLARLL